MATTTPVPSWGLYWMVHSVGVSAASYPTDGRGTVAAYATGFPGILGSERPGRRLYYIVGMMIRDQPAATNTIIVKDAEQNEICKVTLGVGAALARFFSLPRFRSEVVQALPAGTNSNSYRGMPVFDGFTVEQSDVSCDLMTIFAMDIV